MPPVQPESPCEGTDEAHAGQDTDGSCPAAPARPRRHRGPALAACQGPAAALRTPGPGSAGSQPRSSPGTARGLPAHRRAAARHPRGPAASCSRFLGTAAGRRRARTARAGRDRGSPGEPFLSCPGRCGAAGAARSAAPRLSLKWLLPF